MLKHALKGVLNVQNAFQTLVAPGMHDSQDQNESPPPPAP